MSTIQRHPSVQERRGSHRQLNSWPSKAKCELTNQNGVRDVGTCQKGILRSCTAQASSSSDRSPVVSTCC
ncbi:hypothetical protein KCU85_g193, partial [Aureobasidium melanogenum]